MSNELELGRQLGRHETLNVVAARCSAADAILIRDLRDKKLYEGVSQDWEECCVKLLHMSRTNANRIIRNLEEFGPQYFEVSQITRISPATYRAIASSIQDGKLLTDGEAIALVPENADRIAAVVAAVRKEAKVVDPQVVEAEVVDAQVVEAQVLQPDAADPAPEPPPAPVRPEDPFAPLLEATRRVIVEFEKLEPVTRDRERLAAALGACRLRLQMMERRV